MDADDRTRDSFRTRDSSRTEDLSRTEELFERYADTVYRVAVSYGGVGQWAEDVVQEVFVRYLRKHPCFASDEHEKAWFIRVAANCSKSMLSSAWIKRRRPLEECGEQEAPSFRQEEESGLYELLSLLPPKYRIVLYLRYYEEYQVGEIADMLRITPNLVSARLRRAKEMIKKKMSREKEELTNERENLSVHVPSDLFE